MTERERFLSVCEFKPVDRIPNHELNPWSQTIERWYHEGLPREALHGDFMSGEPFFHMDRRYFLPIWVQVSPPFEQIILEETEEYSVFVDESGRTTRRINGSSLGAKQGQYLNHPVEDRDGFLRMKKHYDPATPTRYPLFWDVTVRGLKNRDYPVCLLTNQGVEGDGNFGFYSFLRRWMGVENLSIALYMAPKLIHEMLDFLVDFFIQTVTPALQDVEIDYFNFFEDMSYKTGPMVSPESFKKFFVPAYRKVIDFLHSHNVKHVWVDSDGDCDKLIPGWLEAGVNGLWPLEQVKGVKGTDPREIRKKYGKDLVLAGGIDKFALAKDRRAIEEEVMAKVPPLLEQGGYIPTLDHDAPPEVPYENFLCYMELKKKLIGISK